MEYTKDLVSVIIPTYKRTDTIIRAVDSVINQTYNNIECIVVNDNEVGDKYSIELNKILEDYICNEKIVFLNQEHHKNGAAARNYGIRHAKGEYIAFLDDDDWWKLDKISKQVEFIKKQAEECAVVSTLVEFYKNNKLVRRTIPYKGGNVYKEVLGREIDVTTCSILVKHSCLDETGYFDENLRRHQELQLLTNLTFKYTLELLDLPLLCVDVDDSSNRASGSEELIEMKNAFFQSVNPVIQALSKKERETIFALHSIDVVYCAVKEKLWKYVLIYIFKILKRPSSIIKIVERIHRRYIESKVTGEVL
ncbi:glycosyltransferase family 2 protein [Butyrivibrio sp. INlla21]|uniref:glycosyltransferase family 2 protein n=1 Tax=Butyrivibrio sp. INlla21 TaxID=1520811 RepID=UPI0008EA139F|nr:glycosyltransferase family 2 protein [Butyrivibrio sp. INlla21]SFV02795.1 Glycosyl transferase family 2 [Butyrivibrio sp. INlla21]